MNKWRRSKGWLVILLLGTMLLAQLPPFALAAPVVDNSAGRWFDDYDDAFGIATYNNIVVDPAAGIVRLAAGQTAGWYATVVVRPTSFDAWGQIVVAADYAAAADLTVNVQDGAGAPIPGYQNLPLGAGGAISLAALDPVTYPAIKVQINLTASTTRPVVYSLTVTWNAIARLLIDKSGPTQASAGAPIVYKVNYSNSFVTALDMVVWDTLPRESRGTVQYPTAYGQDDQPTVSWIGGGGQVCGASPCTVGSEIVPAYSIYWLLNDVPAGRTGTLDFALLSPNGTLSNTLYINSASAAAENAATVQSAPITTRITSQPAPYVAKAGGQGTMKVEGKTYVDWPRAGRGVQFILSDPLDARDANDYAATGREDMYNSVLYDNFATLVGTPPKILFTPGNPCSGIHDISTGGTCINSYVPPSGGAAFPAVVWDKGTLEPGAVFQESFSVTLVPDLPGDNMWNQVCLDSDQTDPVCAELALVEGYDAPDYGIFAKGDDLDGVRRAQYGLNDDSYYYAQPGGVVRYLLFARNNSAPDLGDVIMLDWIRDEVTFDSAALPPEAAGSIFYATTLAFPDPHSPPPFTYTNLPDLDLPGNNYWFPYPPSVPADVTWIAFHIPRISSILFPPDAPVSTVFAEYNVVVDNLVDPCDGQILENWGQFWAFRHAWPKGAPLVPIPDGPLHTEDKEITFVRPAVGDLSLDPSRATLTPVVVAPAGQTVYQLRVVNYNTPTSDTATNVRADIQWSQVPANGILTYLSFISVTGGTLETFDPANGHLVLNLGTMQPGDVRLVRVGLGLPDGVPAETPFTVAAVVTGEDDEACTVTPGNVTIAGQVAGALPLLQLYKEDAVDVIPPGDLLTYTLTFWNLSHIPTEGTLIFDHVPEHAVFQQATGPHGERVYVSAAQPPTLPSELTMERPLTMDDIAAYFTLAQRDDGGTPGDPSDDTWTSQFGEATTWVAWLVDDPALGLFPVGVVRQVGLLVRNDEDPGPALVGSLPGTLMFNEPAIIANGLLPAIANEVRTTVAETPGLDVRKTGPSVVASGESFDWLITYYNNSLAHSGNDTVAITDTLPDGIIYQSAAHTWNARALANGAPPDNNGQPVPTGVFSNPDGTTEAWFAIADAYRGGNLMPWEGGTITLHVQAESGLPSGTVLTNNVCGEASNITGTIGPVCAQASVVIANADLWQRKSVDVRDPRAGDTVTWILALSNEGPHEAVNVRVVDTLPAGMTYIPGSAQMLTPHYTFGQPFVSGQTLEWSVARGNALSDDRYSPARPGVLRGLSEDVYITFRATVNGGTPPGTTLTNNVTAYTDTPEEGGGTGVYPNSASDVVITPWPNPALTKDEPALGYPGGLLTSRILYRNKNGEDATNAYILHSLQDYDGDGTVDTTFVSTSATGPGAVGIWYHAGPVTPRPSYPGAGWTTDPTGLTVAHIAYVIGTLPRRSGPYAIQTTVQLTDPDTGLPLAAGTVLTNTAEIFADSDADLSDNWDDAVAHIPDLDMALEKTGSTEGAYPGLLPGDALTYTITIRNSGPTTAYGIKVSDTLPLEVTLLGQSFMAVELTDDLGQRLLPVDASGQPIAGVVPVTLVQSGNRYTWYLGSTNVSDPYYYRNVGLPVRAQQTFDLMTSINSAVDNGTLVYNPAEVITDRRNDGEPPESYLGNNADDSAVVVYTTDLYTVKTVVDETGSTLLTDAGHILTYAIGFGNLGGAAAENVVISENIPTGTTYVPGSLVVPAGATATFYPNTQNPTRFELRFADPLAAPATYDSQSAASGWRTTAFTQATVGTTRIQRAAAGNFGDTGNMVMALTNGDFNGDGNEDLAVAGWAAGGTPSPYNRVYFGDGTGQFAWGDSGAFGTADYMLGGIIAGDVDGDGDLDLVTGNDVYAGGYAITVWKNDGAGRFSAASDFGPQNVVHYMFALTDLDGDSDLDLVATGFDFDMYMGALVEVYANDGNGNFSAYAAGALDDQWCNTAYSRASVAPLDADRDGATDIALACQDEGGVYVFRNNGSGVFTLLWSHLDGNLVYVVPADYDGDGDADLLCGGLSDDVPQLWLNNGSGSFVLSAASDDLRASPPAGDPSDVLAFDVDADGDTDIVYAGYSVYRWWQNDGAGQFTTALPTETSDWGYGTWGNVRDVAIGDWNGDGTRDLAGGIIFTAGGDSRVYLTNHDWNCVQLAWLGFPSVPQPGPAGYFGAIPPTSYGAAAVFDANGDGLEELAVGAVNYDEELSQVYNPAISPPHLVRQEAGDFDNDAAWTQGLVAGDVNGDGLLDLVRGTDYVNRSRVFVGAGDGTFTQVDAGQFDDKGLRMAALALADVTGDGNLDIIAGQYISVSQVYRGNGDGTFTLIDAGDYDNAGRNVRGVVVADLDGDSDLDIAEINGSSTRGVVYLNNGSGWFTVTPAGAFNATGQGYYLQGTDIDGDGDIDLLLRTTDSRGRLYKNDGLGVFTQANAGVWDDQLYFLTAWSFADLDADGDQDVLLARYYDMQPGGNPTLLALNDGYGRFSYMDGGELTNRRGWDTYNIAVGQFDTDGDPDVALVTLGYEPAAPYARSYLLSGYYETATVTFAPITPEELYPNSGPLVSWGQLVLNQDTPAGSDVTYDVLNPSTGVPYPNMAGLRPDSTGRISLAALDPASVTAIQVRAHLAQGDLRGPDDRYDVGPQLCYARADFRMGTDPSFTFQVQVDDPTPPGQTRIDNVVSIATSTPEESYSNNVATDTIWLLLANLALEKTVDKAAALEGEALLYTVAWVNQGPAPAPNSVLTDTLPVGVAYVAGSAMPPETALYGTGAPGDPYRLVWNLGLLAVGQSGTVQIPVTVQAGTAGQTLVNTARIATSRAETRYDDNQDSASTYIGTLTNLWITKSGPTWALVGGLITYTLQFANAGNAPAPNVVVSDTLPAGVSFVSASPAPDEVVGQVVRWTTIGTLNPGQGGSITMVGQVANDPALVDTILHNVVRISTTAQETTLADNMAVWDTYLLLEPCRLSGYVWHDRNGNVVRLEPDEPGLAGVTVQLIGTDFRGQAVNLSTQTAADGYYEFTALLPGTYLVTETQPSGWVSTGAVEGNLGGTVFNPDRIINIPPRAGDSGWEYNFGENQNPTSVRLTYFGVSAGAEGVEVRWETASEHDNVGFNLYRNISLDGLGARLNVTLIPSRSPGGDQGATYFFIDATAGDGTTYYYHLEDVDMSGRTTLHGPVVIALWRVYLPLVGHIPAGTP